MGRLRGMNVSHHLGITFQEKVSEGASHLKRAGFRRRICVNSWEIKGKRNRFGMKTGFGEWCLLWNNLTIYVLNLWSFPPWLKRSSIWRDVFCLLIQPVTAVVCLLVQKCSLTPGVDLEIQARILQSLHCQYETLSPETGKEVPKQMCAQMGLIWFPVHLRPHTAGSLERLDNELPVTQEAKNVNDGTRSPDLAHIWSLFHQPQQGWKWEAILLFKKGEFYNTFVFGK